MSNANNWVRCTRAQDDKAVFVNLAMVCALAHDTERVRNVTKLTLLSGAELLVKEMPEELLRRSADSSGEIT
jgi:hypothetical protein